MRDRQTVEEAGVWLMTIGGFKYAEFLIGRLLRAMLTLTPFPSPCFKSLFPLNFNFIFNRKTVTRFESWGPALQSLSFPGSVSLGSSCIRNLLPGSLFLARNPRSRRHPPDPFPFHSLFSSPQHNSVNTSPVTSPDCARPASDFLGN